MQVLFILNMILAVLFTVTSLYQLLYVVLSVFRKQKTHQNEGELHRYGVLIAARNEELVIGHLLDCILDQDYPQEYIDVFVIADNCSDATAQVARRHGAVVYERHDDKMIGKGHALCALLRHIADDYPDTQYDGFFVFDADNLIEKNYISEMNRVFSEGHKVITSYRNTKNYGYNWITGGYGLYFARESAQMNSSREYIGSSCFVSGTGYLFASSLLKNSEWQWFTLTEDLEFSAYLVSRGVKIAYCRTAVLYDEQPVGFKVSLLQRARWIRGYFQVIARYGGDLVKGLFKKGGFACYDLLMNMMPLILTVFSFIFNFGMLILGMTVETEQLWVAIVSCVTGIGGAYLILFSFGLCATLTEWKKIRCSAERKIRYVFTFPFFIFSFCIAVLMAAFMKPQWRQIDHNVAVSLEEIQ